MRMAEFGVLHRNELSGTLSGLTRVRRFVQDDAHIFVRPEQIKQEVLSALFAPRMLHLPLALTFLFLSRLYPFMVPEDPDRHWVHTPFRFTQPLQGKVLQL